MGFELESFRDDQLESSFLEWLVDEQSGDIQSHFTKLWEYYTNRMVDIHGGGSYERKVNELGRSYVQAQEYGLPSRITGISQRANGGIFGGQALSDIQRKEIVIENDIAWRISAAVDFLFGKPISIVSTCSEKGKAEEIEAILKAVFSSNGGIGFFQDMAVLGSVYGFVDCIVRPSEQLIEQLTSISSSALGLEGAVQLAKTMGLELIEAPRALPILDENDYKKIRYYVQHFYPRKNSVEGKDGFLSRLMSQGGRSGDSRKVAAVTEIISDKFWQRYEKSELVSEGENYFGFLPVVHIQNMAMPFYYEGASDVEPLVPLQDELNTRLSDRANRITFQSFKMYLGKGIENFYDRPVSPGRMWHTDNPDATIEEFGGDSQMPSEEEHIAEIRAAMDKVSSVTPLVAGVIGGKIGNLTSAVALRLTLMGMLSKTERKRFTYGQGIKDICRLVLSVLDKAGAYETSETEREVDILFPSPLPENMMEKLQEAQIKKELGVSSEQVLRELGYDTKYE